MNTKYGASSKNCFAGKSPKSYKIKVIVDNYGQYISCNAPKTSEIDPEELLKMTPIKISKRKNYEVRTIEVFI